MQHQLMQATQHLSSTNKVGDADEPATEACTSDKESQFSINDHTEENCFMESDVDYAQPFHKRARSDA